MSYLNLGNYNDEVANISNQYSNLMSKADEIYNVKEKANKMVENIGGIKAFISGKPISKYLISKGKAGLKNAFEKVGADLKNARSEFQAGKNGISQIPKTDSIMGRFGSQLNTEGTATELPDVIANPIAEGLPDVIAEPIAGGGFGSTSYAESAVARIMGNGGLQRNLRPPTPQNLQPPNQEDSGILKQSDEDINKVETVEKDDEQYEKNIAKDDRGTGEKGEEEEEEGEEEGDIGGDAAGDAAAEGAGAALDSIPGPTEIIGLLLGAGMAIGAAVHKPKEQTPADHMNASFQVGL